MTWCPCSLEMRSLHVLLCVVVAAVVARVCMGPPAPPPPPPVPIGSPLSPPPSPPSAPTSLDGYYYYYYNSAAGVPTPGDDSISDVTYKGILALILFCSIAFAVVALAIFGVIFRLVYRE